MAEEFFIPKLGQTVEEVVLLNWLVEDGAEVDFGDAVLEVETDKAVFPVEANAAGTLHIGPYKAGETVPVLTVVAVIGEPDEEFSVSAAKPETTPEPTEEAASTEAPQPAPEAATPAPPSEGRVFASPRARKLAAAEGVDLSLVPLTGGGGVRVAERDVTAYLESEPKSTPVARKMATDAGVDLRQVAGTGPGGKITREDVERAVSAPAAPAAAAAPTPAVLPPIEILERVPLKGIKAIVADRMAVSVHTTARVTLMMEVDATNFVDMRQRLKEQVADVWGFTPGYNDLLIKIVAAALREFPYMNARITADAIEYVAPVNIGLAADTDRGLLVPVVRDADKKSLRDVGTEFRELIDRAREGKSLPDDLSGGTFTITNLGMYDIDAFTPVINLPEAAILGVGRIAPKVVAYKGEMAIRQMWTLSLVHDHRIVDGAPAAKFLQYIKRLVEEPYLWIAL
jgi:pyruvate dehydrogenase E2 component (dihydrolipoamide acetyltransferase)